MMNVATMFYCGLIVIATFLLWEGVAWFSHKYIMHGFLWTWHKSHHTVHQSFFERNDLFAVVFSLPSIALIAYFTLVKYNPYLVAVGVGIFCYGLFYFIFHDVIVHQRLRWRPRKQSRYLRRMIHAHYIHHNRHTKEGCQAFGFLWAPGKYEPKEFRLKEERSETQ